MFTVINGQKIRVTLGKGIRFYRQQRQFSQATLAEKANISITFLSNIERGIKYPASETLSAIANGLDVEVSELFRNDNSPAEDRNLYERFKIDIKKKVIEALDAVYKTYE